MASKVIIPKFGWMMTEGQIVKWHKQEGDFVAEGDILFEVTTDKSIMDVESSVEGYLIKVLVQEGDSRKVGDTVAYIGEEGETVEDGEAPAAAEPKAEAAPAEEKAAAPAALSENEYEVCVIGGGPGGYVTAIKAAQEGLKTCLIEEKVLGGTCLNIGCIPTKALLKSVEVLDTIKNAADFGVVGDGSAFKLDMEAVQNRKNQIVKELTGGVGMLLAKNGATVYNGKGSFVDSNTVKVGDTLIKAKNIVVATGSKIRMLDIPVAKEIPLYTSDDVLGLTEIPKKVAVIGGGVIGIELAYFLAKAGAEVFVVEFMDKILPNIDVEIAAIAEKYLKKEGIEIHTSAKVTEVAADGIVFEKDGKAIKESCTAVLMAVGRGPCTDGLDVENAGLKVEKGAIVTDEYLKTNVDGIYAIGDVNGKYMLAHTASAEGLTVVENILGHKEKFNYNRVPSGIYLHPEIAAVGVTEEQAVKDGKKIKVGKFPLVGNGKAKVEGCADGMIKIIADEQYGEVLGVHMIAPHATDMIAEISTIMQLEGTVDEMLKVVHPHPTVSEAVHEAFHAVHGKAIHI
ncbi:MAG: dihydrolipoyl dehydrogenase [Firmicutes bacterium]|nr:dihydrolipoyl dehydrogenase [Bacillota bacterium]